MLETLLNAWRVPDLRRRVLFTFYMFVIFRVGAHVPVPGINPEALAQVMQGALFGFFDIVSGGALKRFTVFAMGIMPYINASIIMQLLTVVVPSLERMAKEGEDGRRKIVQYTRYGTVLLAFIQGIGMSLYLGRASGVLLHPGIGTYLSIAVILTAGTTFLMWLGEQITEKGIGNGISLLIFAGIVARLPAEFYSIYEFVRTGTVGILTAIGFAIFAVAVVAAVVAMNEGQRRIPVQYSKRVVGRRVYGGQSTHIPLKVNQAGVIPVIFAMSILLFPSTIASWFPGNALAQGIVRVFNVSSVPYMVMYAALIIFFTYFYTAVTFNPQDVADNMRKYGGFIPGLRPGRPTAEYIDHVLSRLTLAGAIFLAAIAVLPTIVTGVTGLNVYFGGTSLLIVVGVALDTVRQMESQLLMRHYQGFMK
ncbi:MAG: preprotein translocase subunit SecY [Clostridia bacterium]|nr:MAG: preprotein translocase subunit SecY [Clostridia bacterium]